jgi:hypothetical protein
LKKQNRFQLIQSKVGQLGRQVTPVWCTTIIKEQDEEPADAFDGDNFKVEVLDDKLTK